jgi:hypothetical protein
MFPLRLAPSMRETASNLAQRDSISLNHFISIAVAEKIARMEQAASTCANAEMRSRPAPLSSLLADGGLRKRYLA